MSQQSPQTLEQSLVPSTRLATLLSTARADRGITLEELADSSGGEFSLAMLSSIERGTRQITDEQARVLAALYKLDAGTVIPPRSKLIVDLEEGRLLVDDNRTRLGRRADRDDVLTRYLAMVYAMRHIEPGTPIPLRVDDLDVLGRALRVGSRTLTADLQSLMANPDDLVGWRTRILRRKVLFPAAGVLVAFCGVGALLLVQPAEAPSTTNVNTPAAAVNPSSPLPSADIGEAIVQERGTDGSAGPVQVRSKLSAGEIVPSAPLPAAEIGEAAVQERDPAAASTDVGSTQVSGAQVIDAAVIERDPSEAEAPTADAGVDATPTGTNDATRVVNGVEVR